MTNIIYFFAKKCNLGTFGSVAIKLATCLKY
jgi:hypothetical protein